MLMEVSNENLPPLNLEPLLLTGIVRDPHTSVGNRCYIASNVEDVMLLRCYHAVNYASAPQNGK